MKSLMVQIQVRTTEENREWLKALAEAQERSVNWMINKIIGDARLATQPSENVTQ
jgi:hypothetical protein